MNKLIVLFACVLLSGCFNNTTIHTNRLYQTDYDYQCFSGNKTWSEIVICLDTQNQAERAQNKVTNDILDTLNT